MRAWVLHDIGYIRLSERAMPEPRQGEVLVRVHAVGVCGSDIPRIYQTCIFYQYRKKYSELCKVKGLNHFF